MFGKKKQEPEPEKKSEKSDFPWDKALMVQKEYEECRDIGIDMIELLVNDDAVMYDADGSSVLITWEDAEAMFRGAAFSWTWLPNEVI